MKQSLLTAVSIYILKGQDSLNSHLPYAYRT